MSVVASSGVVVSRGQDFMLPYDCDPDLPVLSEAFWGDEYVPQEDSGFGASYHSVLLMCPRRYFYRNVENLVPDWMLRPGVHVKKRAAQRGLLMHHCHEVLYTGWKGRCGVLSREAQDVAFYKLAEVARKYPDYDAEYTAARKRHPGLVTECERLLSAYVERYRVADSVEYEVCGVELPAHVLEHRDGEEFLFTVRYDLVVRNRSTGVYFILDHKHEDRFDESEQVRWRLDIQAQGLAFVFRRNWPQLPFGGVIRNVVVTSSPPSFQRPVYTFSEERLEAFGNTMRAWQTLRASFARLDWPENPTACASPFPGARGGTCDYMELCLAEWAPGHVRGQPPPGGFVRKERLVQRGDFR